MACRRKGWAFVKNYDVLVIGGGPGGVPAAVAAARAGARTLLVERYGFLGGMATAGLVNPFMGYWAGKRPVIAGIFAEMMDRLRAEGALAKDNQTFDEEAYKFVLDDIVRESGADVLFHTTFVRCRTTAGRIESLELVSKGGPFEVSARIYVDASGDADVAASAGARVEMGRAEDGLCQPMTLCFRVAGIDRSQCPDFGELRKLLTKVYLGAKARGAVTNPREDILTFKTLRDDVLHFNTTRVTGKSAIDPAELTAAEFEARRQARELVVLFRGEVPGFGNAYLQKAGLLIGVRESRRVMASYVLTMEDVVGARKFGDAIACSTYPVDIHNPAGTGTVIRHLPPNEWYEIPYRCLVPEGQGNLLMASRSISATHEAHSSMRVMPVVAAIGQAAGTAAAMAVRTGIEPSKVAPRSLREALRAAGAFVGDGQ